MQKPPQSWKPTGDGLFVTSAFLFLTLTLAWGANYQPPREKVALRSDKATESVEAAAPLAPPAVHAAAVVEAPASIVTIEGGLEGDTAPKGSWVF